MHIHLVPAFCKREVYLSIAGAYLVHFRSICWVILGWFGEVFDVESVYMIELSVYLLSVVVLCQSTNITSLPTRTLFLNKGEPCIRVLRIAAATMIILCNDSRSSKVEGTGEGIWSEISLGGWRPSRARMMEKKGYDVTCIGFSVHIWYELYPLLL